jgi:cytochrome oxidase Cu insertion factor (SCO1/SenC/PrrC family)
MKTSAVRYWVLLALVAGAMYGSLAIYRKSRPVDRPVGANATVRPAVSNVSAANEQSIKAQAAMASGPVAPFKLTDQDGQEFDSASLDGKVWVASFFFTNCPAICWRMNQALAAWQHTHPNADVHFVSITCDPDNDTPAALKTYANHFKADPKRWTFLTGDMKQIQAVGQDSFKIAVVKGDHSDRACVVDKSGKIRGRFRLTEPDQAELLDRLLDVVTSEPAATAAAASESASPAVATEPKPAEPQPAADAPPATTAAAVPSEAPPAP